MRLARASVGECPRRPVCHLNLVRGPEPPAAPCACHVRPPESARQLAVWEFQEDEHRRACGSRSARLLGDLGVSAEAADGWLESKGELPSAQDNERFDLKVGPSGVTHARQTAEDVWDLRPNSMGDA